MTQVTATKDRVRIKHVEVLSDDWYVLRKTTYDYLGRNGQWRELTRETYDRGNGATILLYSKAKQTVVLTRQFRLTPRPLVYRATCPASVPIPWLT
ncbi:GDP-mannose pyrophosphatase NudK [compost metagenome]